MAKGHVLGNLEIENSGVTLNDLTKLISDGKLNTDIYLGDSNIKLSDLINHYNVTIPRYVYNSSGGSKYCYEIFRIKPTGGWGGINISFICQTYNGTDIAFCAFSYYNNSAMSGKYLFKTDYLNIYYKKNSDNTVSIFCYVGEMYRPLSITLVGYTDDRFAKPDIHYGNATPNAYSASVPSGVTEFSS